MDVVSIIMAAAKSAQVSGILLVGICGHESGNFKHTYAPHDHGSPSFGICQVKLDTAKFLKFKGTTKDLMDPKVNARYAALYLKYQQRRYGKNDWVKLVSSYNAGTYFESKKTPGCPKNLTYVKLVQKRLSADYKDRLDCGY